ncbi:MAG: putative two-component response regulator [Anaerolineales bacterium]|nr:putative two-component response regulator [Anaerolineales bacterium]
MDHLPFPSVAEPLLDDLAEGRCAALVGLSNTGKSTLMRGLASEAAARRFRDRRGRPITLVLVDCNRAVALSAQAFYEIVVRSVLEAFPADSTEPLPASLRMHHEGITDADSSFAASLSFNLALNELCEQLGQDVALLLDEFDEVYTALDDRALLNLRALYDRFSERLKLVTATTRALRELRGRDVEDEFAELFVQSTYPMPPLTEAEALAELGRLLPDNASPPLRRACMDLAGGHPGLLVATAQSAGAIDGRPLSSSARRVFEDLGAALRRGAGSVDRAGDRRRRRPGARRAGQARSCRRGERRPRFITAVDRVRCPPLAQLADGAPGRAARRGLG